MDTPGFSLDDFLPYRLVAAAEKVSRAFAQRYRHEFGLSIAEWRVLAHLHAAGGAAISIRDIEARVAMEKSKVSRAVSRLEAAGLLEKALQDSDKRLLNLHLTAEGAALVARIIPVALEFQDSLKARLGAEAEALERALRHLEAKG